MKDVFSRAYNEMWWGRGSGVGSTVNATVEYRAYVAGIMHGLRVRTVLDIGCGDWEFSRLIDWTNIRYTGWDVVPQLIKRNQALFRFASFTCVDARTVPLPDVDLIIVKDVLQ